MSHKASTSQQSGLYTPLRGVVTSNVDLTALPYFQQLQVQLAAHIRNPDEVAYQPDNEQPIEPRRLKAYQDLFFNNLQDFFSQLFPVCKQILGDSRWNEVVREYMVKHNAKTPLFHQLGEEFLIFLESEFSLLEADPKFLLELAHYEWVELALSVSEEVGLIVDDVKPIDLDLNYELSPLAWLLAYEWPVHQLAKDFQPSEKPVETITLLVYRTEDKQGNERVDFMNLTPLLYQWLLQLPEFKSAKAALLAVTHNIEIDENTLFNFAKQTLQQLQALAIVKPL
ncbi:HvfC family RiPP maturation protein [Thiomicrorhabdus lithotrophica]|uniref:DNA-binding domain-containing protein n=1 Tax=Thiomicrorhabdus lithotrophica TaxID=2949997 RepID=A0ABY8CBV4_9GAMM|nr:putative DNA-binding domain-containing protein [Thiomicrorhabdus lithotrophica]WEJ62287.1 putative DNA-binding domain-containing protein [Thiomicrorhabdus lithotrophica]